MTPVFLICPPRAKGTLLMRMLNASPGNSFAGESDEMLSGIRKTLSALSSARGAAQKEAWPRHLAPASSGTWRDTVTDLLSQWCAPSPGATHYGVRSSFLGREGWKQACDWWSWLLETWPNAKLIFLTRDQGEIELSMWATLKLWIPAYGKCSGCIGQRAHDFLASMARFHEMNPDRSTLLDASQLSDFEATSNALAPIGVSLDRDGWAQELAIISGGRRDPRVEDLKKTEEEEHPAFRSGTTYEDMLRLMQEQEAAQGQVIEVNDLEEDTADPGHPLGPPAELPPGVTAEWVADPFGENEPAAPEDYEPKAPRAFVEFPAWHERAIVIPWLSTAAAWDELKFCLRSIEANFEDKTCPIIIIGDRPPPWLQPGGRARFLPVNYTRRKRGQDVGLWHARWIGLQLADETLWLMDDIFLLRPCGWADFQMPFSEGRLKETEGKSPFRKGMRQSLRDLKLAGSKRPVRFASHAPMVYRRAEMLEIFRGFHVPFSGGLENLYCNRHWRGERRTKGFKATRLPARPGALWLNLNVDAETDSRAPLMAMFPDPAPWEIPAPAESGVPKIIHQTWATEDYPRDRYPQHWQDSWRELHPEWEYRFWTDADLLQLAADHYPAFLEPMRRARGIIKSDLGRLLILHRHGGLYADMDYQALKPMDDLLRDGEAFVSSFQRPERLYIHNALMAGKAGHPMFLELALKGLERVLQRPDGAPEWLTGPELFMLIVPEWDAVHLSADAVCPIDWTEPRRDWRHKMDNPAEHFPVAHAVTWWRHGW